MILIILILAITLISCEEKSSKDSSKGSSIEASNEEENIDLVTSLAPEEEKIDPGLAASFASEVFAYVSFPFIETWYLPISGETWDWDKFSSLDRFIDGHKNNGGQAFRYIFKRLYLKYRFF